jgi:hypothetical protein
VAGVLEGYRLLFDHIGVPFFEPSFANVAPEKGCRVHGVLHDLSARCTLAHPRLAAFSPLVTRS